MHIRKNLFAEIKRQKNTIHLVLIGTKPDIIKQAPLILKLKERGHYTLVVHSGQHQDYKLSGGVEKEFGIVPDINLEVSGKLYQQQSQIILRLGQLLKDIKDLKKQVIPYICADTTTAVAAGIASFANLISTAHVEAGLRTMSPPKDLMLSLLHETDTVEYFKSLKIRNWQKGSYEPYPEQFDTRAAGPSAGIHFAPTSLNASHLVSEGYAKERIFVVGNTVSDALKFIEKKVINSDIFDKFPQLSLGQLIRFCIHRRENIISYQRFISIYEAMEELVREGRRIVFISLPATEAALITYGLKVRVNGLVKKHKNFFYSQVLPSYADAIAIMKNCIAVATDSGSIQEETNILGIPGIVLRFNSDRPEAIFAGGNVLAPPMTKDVVLKVVYGVLDNQNQIDKMIKSPKLYGKSVSEKTVSVMERSIGKNSAFNIFEFMEHERLGLTKKPFWKKGKTLW